MSTENTIVEPAETDLDAFAAELFGQSDAAPEPTSSEGDETDLPESDASTEDTHADEADTLAPDEDDETGEEEDSTKEEAPKPRKNRSQERIEQLLEKNRLLEEKFNRFVEEQKPKEDKPAPVKAADTTPLPTDTNEDGTDKYPLGEYDPLFIQDVVKHTIAEERKALNALENEKKVATERETAVAELQASWNDKLVPAKERYPDFVEKGDNMVSVFSEVDETYGEYLATTIMDMEYGPDVFYYLANNLDEAHKIVQSGAKKATIALGRLEAKFAFADDEKQKARPRVSKAPPPPEHQNKGSAAVAPPIRGDEKDIDLDAFSRELFKKPGS